MIIARVHGHARIPRHFRIDDHQRRAADVFALPCGNYALKRFLAGESSTNFEAGSFEYEGSGCPNFEGDYAE
jgi:hypothetical protein